jgi:hypothetical protein
MCAIVACVMFGAYHQNVIFDAVGASNDTATSTLFVARDSFHPDNLGWPRRIPCGSFKCFYRLKTAPQVGYLVAHASTKQQDDGVIRSRLTALLEGWQLGEKLRNEYGIQHFMLEPPSNTTVTFDLAQHLNYNLFSEKHHKYFTDKMVRTKGFHEGTDIYYQKMQLAPKNHLILGCVESKMTVFQQRLAHFCSLVEDKELFLDNIQGHFATARKLLEKEPCLVKDFQVMLDASGQVYHLDFDRCFSSSGSKWHMSSDFTETCFQSLDGMEHSLEKALLNDTNNKLRD